jgi:putative transposase
MIEAVWREMATEFPRITLDAFVVMPNHLHAILHLARQDQDRNPRLGNIIQRYKSITTARYSTGIHTLGWPPYDRRLWQNEFYDHIIRDANDLDRSRRYIAANPANWHRDRDRDPSPRHDAPPATRRRTRPHT